MEDNDHDLLIQVKTKLDDLLIAVNNGNKMTDTKMNDHEVRIRRLELWGALAIGGLTVVQFVLNYIK